MEFFHKVLYDAEPAVLSNTNKTFQTGFESWCHFVILVRSWGQS